MSLLPRSRTWSWLLIFFACVSIAVGCDDVEAFTDDDILVIGGSVMAWNRDEDVALAEQP